VPDFEPRLLYVLAGLGCGLIMGAAARRVRFCTFGAIEDVILAGSTVRLRTWFLAMGIAILATQFLASLDFIRLDQSIYHATTFQPLAAAVGGIMFGFGMALAGNCGYGTIIRMSSGDLRALAVFVAMGISAYGVARGILNPLRRALFGPVALSVDSQHTNIPDVMSSLVGMNGLVATITLCAVLFIWCFASPTFRKSWRDIGVAITVGLTIPLAFYLTSRISEAALEDGHVEALSYALPLGETLVYFMTYTGTEMDFTVAAVIGTVLGAFIVAALRRELHLEGFDEARDMRRHLLGACLMGAGGVLAGGCTVGQGLSGMAAGSLSAPIAVMGILVGAASGVQYLVGGNVFDILGALASHDVGFRDTRKQPE
jgi:uncharacterized protein